jgi:hypothetical protein
VSTVLPAPRASWAPSQRAGWILSTSLVRAVTITTCISVQCLRILVENRRPCEWLDKMGGYSPPSGSHGVGAQMKKAPREGPCVHCGLRSGIRP